MRIYLLLGLISFCGFFLSSCGTAPVGDGNLSGNPSEAARAQQIASEPRGNFYYGRRYYVPKTRFWGYLRKPGRPWSTARLVIFNEKQKLNPDRFPETGSGNRRYGFDQNYEYRIHGRYTGRKLYEPNSNQILPEFLLTDYKLLNKKPGWLFRPTDKYSTTAITLRP